MFAEQRFVDEYDFKRNDEEISYANAFQTLIMLFRNQLLEKRFTEQCSDLSVGHFDQLLTLARKMNMPAAIMALPLDKILLKQLPAVLLMDDQKTLVVTNIRDDGYVVIDPETQQAHLESAKSLIRHYAGMLFSAKPIYPSWPIEAVEVFFSIR